MNYPIREKTGQSVTFFFLHCKKGLSERHVLAINTFETSKQALSINPNGGHVKLDFNFPGNAEIYMSCSLVFENIMYVFGGGKEARQISQVSLSKGCGIERIGDLPFSFDTGACTVIKDEEIMLCFSLQNEGRICRVDKKPTGSFDKISSESNYYHYQSSIASIEGKFNQKVN